MSKGKYAARAAGQRAEKAHHELTAAQQTIDTLKAKLAAAEAELAHHERETSTQVLRRAEQMLNDRIDAINIAHSRELETAHADTAQLLMYLVEFCRGVDAGEITAATIPNDLPGLLHHFSAHPGELFAKVVNADRSDDPDISVMGSRRNRRADVHSYRHEQAHRRSLARQGNSADSEYDILADPDAWRKRTTGWERHLRGS